LPVEEAVEDVQQPLLDLPPRPRLEHLHVRGLPLRGDRLAEEGVEAPHPLQEQVALAQGRRDPELLTPHKPETPRGGAEGEWSRGERNSEGLEGVRDLGITSSAPERGGKAILKVGEGLSWVEPLT